MTLQIAEVGAFKRRSPEDMTRRVASMVAVLELDPEFAAQPKKFDAINLVDGRDFLREKDTYDMVIVHSVLSPSIGPTRFTEHPELMTSPKHNLKTWRKRLVATRAWYIVIAEGQPHTLSGYELGELPGYTIEKQDRWVTVYRWSGTPRFR